MNARSWSRCRARDGLPAHQYLNGISGLSWTLDRDTAAWFAKPSAPHPEPRSTVVTGRVLKKHIIAMFSARKKHEVLVFPRYVYAREWDRA
jgi:hypothetical protein